MEIQKQRTLCMDLNLLDLCSSFQKDERCRVEDGTDLLARDKCPAPRPLRCPQ